MDLKHLFKEHKTLESFRTTFGKEEDCLRAIAEDKWGQGFVCRKCGHMHYCEGKTPYSRRCTKCKTYESATAHTIFHHCRINIADAFELAYLICCSPNISTYELSRKMHTRQMTCWKFKKRVQKYISEDSLKLTDVEPL